jgi:hypothetical protein
MEKQKFQGDLIHKEPYRIIKESKNDPVDNFFLVLAVVYNDLKGMVFFEKLVFDTYEPVSVNDKISFHMGEYGGIFIQTRKIFISYLREFFEFLKENEQILSSTEFNGILSKTNKDITIRWNNLVDIALNKSKDTSDFTNYLVRVRNNVASHYYQSGKELRKAFCNIFFKKEKVEQNKLAYYAIGENMEKTRFFYADAAVQEYLRSTINDMEKGFEVKYKTELSAIIDNMNWTILRLLKVYLKNLPK